MVTLEQAYSPYYSVRFLGAFCLSAALMGCGGGDSAGDSTGAATGTDTTTPYTGAPEMAGGGGAAMSGGSPTPSSSGHGSDGTAGAGGAPSSGMMSGPPGAMSGGMAGGMAGGMPGGGSSAHGSAGPGSAGPGYAGSDYAGTDPSAGGYPGGYGQSAVNAAPKPARPAEFSAWTDNDFIAAVEERDERVLAAIDFKVKASPGDPSVALLLTRMLGAAPLDTDVGARAAANGMNGGGVDGYPGAYPGAAGAAGAYPGAMSPGAGMPPSSEGHGAPGRSPGVAAPGTLSPGGSPGLSPPGGVAPQSRSIRDLPSWERHENVALLPAATTFNSAVDSVSAMILEASVSYMPQGAGVGAISGQMPGRIEGATGQSSPTPGAAGHAAPGASSPGMGVPPGSSATPGGAGHGVGSSGLLSPPMGSGPGGAMPGAAGGGYPGGGYPGDASGYPGAGAAPNIGNLKERELIERIVDGLIINNTQDAWQTVFGIVAGTVATVLDDITNCEIVVQRLIHNMDNNPGVIQPIILTLLDGSTPLPPQSRDACIRTLAAISAAQTAQFTGFAPVDVPQAAAGGLAGGYPGAAGGGYMPPGEGAYPGMPGGPGMSSSGLTGPPAMGSQPGMSGPPGGLGGYPGMAGFGGNTAAVAKSLLPELNLKSDVILKGAIFLWSPKATAAVVKQLESATDLASASSAVLLASTMPNHEIRHAACECFLRLHDSGSDALNSTGMFSGVHDPGMLVVLKSLPRTKPSKESAGTMDSWTTSSQSLVLALRDELKKSSGNLKQCDEKSLPVKLHKNAVAEVCVMLQFPPASSEPSTPGAPSATQVYYARTTFTPQKKNDQADLVDHYETRASGFQRPDQAKGILWIEGMKSLPNGHRRSMDVVIQQASNAGAGGFGDGGAPGGYGAGPGGGGGAGGTYSVEIIVVDTMDPKSLNPSGTEQASNSK